MLLCAHPVVVHGEHYSCGRCLPCRKRRSNMWGLRLSHEATTMQSAGLFVLLTYNNEYLPLTDEGKPTLLIRDMQLYMKRLRKLCAIRKRNPRTGRMRLVYRKIRYFLCGEYGPSTGRPHYHLVIFGLNMSDRYRIWQAWQKCNYYTFNTGTFSVRAVNVAKYGNAAYKYVSGYVLKRLRGDARVEDVPLGVESEFQTHSLGLGYDFCDAMKLNDKFLMRVGDKWIIPPKAYRKRLNLRGDLYAPVIHAMNVALCIHIGVPPPIDYQDNSWQRDKRTLDYRLECASLLLSKESHNKRDKVTQ